MKIIDMHIGRAIIQSTFASLLVLTSLSGLIRFVEQLKSIGRGSYDMVDAAFYVLYTIPRDIEVFFPMAALLGGLLGLGALASNSELIVMMAAGLSRLDIVKSAMKTSTLLVVCVLVLGEWVAPQFETKAKQLRHTAISGHALNMGDEGMWAKDGDRFIHIKNATNQFHLKGVTVFEFDKQLKLTEVSHIDEAKYVNKQWHVNGFVETVIGDNKISRFESDKASWMSSLTPDKLDIVSVSPEALSISKLLSYLDYLSANEQDDSRYQLAFWRKVFQPITVAVMMLMALSFIFGPLRSTSMGARILMGVVIGFGFHIANRIFGPVALLYDLPAMIGAIMPSILFVVLATYLIQRRA
ncbi:LPS export ABC transporter permease LptG [Algibacillus agarilyticus]|uniref:LPS export ABC transporter permease LptG n=1 Tax=Algibacillus agarilyticus TaxID=2234133 RepID=UPI000DCFBE31|nr:LPS export ABC transporter permease LptG [Algibacillus agarilyticus]